MARLDLNVASRPFVNARPLVLATVLLGVLLAAFTFLNVYWLFGSWHETYRLGRELATNRAEMEEARASTEALQKSISEADRKRIRAVSVSTREIIEKRRLAWTLLFDQIEAVLPRSVRILSIVPDVRSGGMALLMEATAKDNEVKLKFYRKLQERPFRDAYIMGETMESDKIRFQVRCNYDPEGGDAVPIYEPMPWELQRPTPAPTPVVAAAPALTQPTPPIRAGIQPFGPVPPGAVPGPSREPASSDPGLMGGFAPAADGGRP